MEQWTLGIKVLIRSTSKYPHATYAGFVFCLQWEWWYIYWVVQGVTPISGPNWGGNTQILSASAFWSTPWLHHWWVPCLNVVHCQEGWDLNIEPGGFCTLSSWGIQNSVSTLGWNPCIWWLPQKLTAFKAGRGSSQSPCVCLTRPRTGLCVWAWEQ